jgi:hypothetical protein|tara:strand:+ start:1000 stop:1539 length:540 start_codon:yes stop_codon:yes gene_type:complete
MASELKVDKISPAAGTAFTLGDSGDTFTVPSGATIVNSGTATGFNSAGAFDLNGAVLTIDADADTTITSDTDDQIDIAIAGADDFTFTANSFNVLAGSQIDMNGTEIILDADADTSITADTDDQIDVKIGGADDFQFTANTFTIPSGSTVAIAAGGAITNAGSMAPDITSTGKAMILGL